MRILIVIMMAICLLILVLAYCVILLASDCDDRLRELRKDIDEKLEDDGK